MVVQKRRSQPRLLMGMLGVLSVLGGLWMVNSHMSFLPRPAEQRNKTLPRPSIKPLVFTPEVGFETEFWATVDFPPVPPFVINTHDPVSQDMYVSAHIHSHSPRPWDPYLWDLMVSLLHNQPRQLIVDVGANLGYFSFMAAAMGHKVLAFEPMPRNTAKLHSGIQRNGFAQDITLYPYAAMNTQGWVSLQPTHPSNQGNGHIVMGKTDTPSIRLDDFIQQEIFFMKIDVEGFECPVLQGARRLLCQHRIRHIAMEFSHETRHNPLCPPLPMLRFMQGLGYNISDILLTPSWLLPEDFMSFPPNLLFTLWNSSRGCVDNLF